MKSITHSDDKQQQLRRDANVTSLWERHSSCVRGPVHALAPNPRPGVSVVPPHTPGSHTSTDSAFSPSQTQAFEHAQASQSSFSRAAVGPGPNVSADGEKVTEELRNF